MTAVSIDAVEASSCKVDGTTAKVDGEDYAATFDAASSGRGSWRQASSDESVTDDFALRSQRSAAHYSSHDGHAADHDQAAAGCPSSVEVCSNTVEDGHCCRGTHVIVNEFGLKVNFCTSKF